MGVSAPSPPSQAMIRAERRFLRAGFTSRVAWSDDKGMNFQVRQTQVRILNPPLSRAVT